MLHDKNCPYHILAHNALLLTRYPSRGAPHVLLLTRCSGRVPPDALLLTCSSWRVPPDALLLTRCSSNWRSRGPVYCSTDLRPSYRIRSWSWLSTRHYYRTCLSTCWWSNALQLTRYNSRVTTHALQGQNVAIIICREDAEWIFWRKHMEHPPLYLSPLPRISLEVQLGDQELLVHHHEALSRRLQKNVIN